MKILVLNGSPKKEKSDTMHLTHAFLRGMQEAAPQEIPEHRRDRPENRVLPGLLCLQV